MREGYGKAFSDASLLLAEDDPTNADIASRTLRKLGCRVEVASDGVAATRANKSFGRGICPLSALHANSNIASTVSANNIEAVTHSRG